MFHFVLDWVWNEVANGRRDEIEFGSKALMAAEQKHFGADKHHNDGSF